jgi:hypothetical protein
VSVPAPEGAALVTLAAEIHVEHQAAVRCASEAVAHAIRCGELLTQVKASLPHGAFGAWLAANVEFSDRTARGYMQIANADPAIRQRVAVLSLREAMAAIADKSRPMVYEGEGAPVAPSVAWEIPSAGNYSFATWTANGWFGLASVKEDSEHPGYFELRVLVGANETSTIRPVREDYVGLALVHMGVPDKAVWNDFSELDRFAEDNLDAEAAA